MIREEREMLAKVSRLNQALGMTVAEFTTRYPDGVPPDAWRELAMRVDHISDELNHWADVMDGITVPAVEVNL